MNKFNAAKAADQSTEARTEVLDLDESQLDQVGGGDSTPNWQDPPTP